MSTVLGYQPWPREDEALENLDARWRTMDLFEEYIQVLTLAAPPVEELGEPGASGELARRANDEIAEIVAAHPDRFVGFAAALPMGDPEAAATELERAMGELGALGAQLHTNVAGRPLDDEHFAPVLSAADGQVPLSGSTRPAARSGQAIRSRAVLVTASGGRSVGPARHLSAWRASSIRA